MSPSARTGQQHSVSPLPGVENLSLEDAQAMVQDILSLDAMLEIARAAGHD